MRKNRRSSQKFIVLIRGYVFLFLLVLLIAEISCVHPAPSIQKISIRDNNFEIIKTIESPDLLKEAASFWQDLVLVDNSPIGQSTHVIDVESKDQLSGRWRYDKNNGYLVRLSMQKVPRYRVSNIEKFNKLFLEK